MSAPKSFGDGRYIIQRELGKGGQKVVYLAEDAVLHRECAISVIDAEVLGPEDVARLKNEAQTLAKMGAQPQIVTVYDMGQDAGRPYLVCEYVRGGDLADLLRSKGGALPLERALAITADVLRGLISAHERGVVHRDLKPSNIWIGEDGGAKLGDFGIALANDRSRLTATGSVTGTPAYCAPEQLNNSPVDGRTDLYALGCVLYELLTGRQPFLGTVVAVISQQLHAAPTAPSVLHPDLPEALDRFVLQLLAKDPRERPTSAREALATLTAIAAQLSISSLTPAAQSVGAPPMTPRLFATDAATPPLERVPTRTIRRSVALSVGLLLVAAPIVWFATHSAPAGSSKTMHRVAVLAIAGDPPAKSSTAWMITARLIEELDRYDVFRPVSAIGVSLARKAELKNNEMLPDEAAAVALAARLEADTVAAVSVSETKDGDFSIQAHVFATSDPGAGSAGQRVRVKREDLDMGGPSMVAATIVDSLKRHWGSASLSKASDVAASVPVRFDTFEYAMAGEQYCIVGRFDLCEKVFRELLVQDPENAFYLMKLACALSYQGRQEELATTAEKAKSLRHKMTSRRALLIFDQDMAWLEAEEANQKGDRKTVLDRADRIMRLNDELARVYQDPWGLMYSAAASQYFLKDIPAARRMYAQVRQKDPSLFPPYYEEARLMAGDGTEAGKAEAAKLLFTFIRCYPESELVSAARSTWYQLGLVEPKEPVVCPNAARG